MDERDGGDGRDGRLDGRMAAQQEPPRVVRASREIAAGPGLIFELIADPAQQPRWDGNDNLAAAPAGQRVRRAGDVFAMTLTSGSVRDNRVVEFDEGRRIAWMPAEPGQQPPGHLWRWELEPAGPARTKVTCTYDWTRLTDDKRIPRARATTPDRLRASLDRLAVLAEGSDDPQAAEPGAEPAEAISPLVAHQRAQRVFSAVLANVGPGQMDGPTPCEEWTVRDLIEHVIGGNERVVIRARPPADPSGSAVRAGAAADVADDPGGAGGDPGGAAGPAVQVADLAEAHRVSAARAQAVFAALDGMTRIFDLPIGPVPGSSFIRIRTTDALVHAWDLAQATGQATDLDPELATRMLAASRRHMDDSMRGRFFGYPQPCDQDRPPADQLAAFLGRPVH